MATGTAYPTQETGRPTIVEGDINWDVSADVQKDLTVPQRIHRMDRATAGSPILGFSTRIGGPRTVKNWIFYMLRTRRFRDYIAAGSTFTATATTFTFAAADIALLLPGFYIVNLDTKEMMEVVSKSGTTVTVNRGVGTVVGTANSTTTDTFMILGYTGSEGDSKFFGLSKTPEVIFNHVGELQDTFSITQWEDAGGKLPGAETPQAKERIDHLENMRMNYEKRALFDQRGKRQRANLDNKTVWTPNGLDSFCTENETNFSGDITEAKLLNWADDLARFSKGNSITLMCSPKFARKLNISLSGRMRNNSPVLKKAGLDVSQYDAGGLLMNIFRHPLFYDDISPAAVTDALNGHAYAVPFDDFKPVTIKGRLTGWFKWRMNVETPGDRKIQDQLYCDYGFHMVESERYGRGFNVGT